jgi:Disulfide bond formation protein DsbB
VTDLVISALAAFAVVGQIALLLLVVLLPAARWSPGARAALDAFRRDLRGFELWAAFGVALVASLGSLFLSEVADFQPCSLCWAQRAVMYPLVPILGAFALFAGRADARRHAAWLLGIPIVGAAIATYHVILERFEDETPGVCGFGAVSCTTRWVWEFGYVSIPLMALTAFGLIIALLALAWRAPRA